MSISNTYFQPVIIFIYEKDDKSSLENHGEISSVVIASTLSEVIVVWLLFVAEFLT